MSNNWYPDISAKSLVPLQVVKESLKTDPLYLTRDECPYSKEIVQLLKEILGGTAIKETSSFFRDGDDDPETAVLRELTQIYDDAMSLKDELEGVGDAGEKIQLLKARTQMLQKLIDIRAQTLNLKRIADFQATVVQYMEDVLSPDQITDFLEKVRQ